MKYAQFAFTLGDKLKALAKQGAPEFWKSTHRAQPATTNNPK